MSNFAAIGAARVFRHLVAERAVALDLALAEPALRREVADFAKKGTVKGRDRALLRLRRRIDPFARFHIARLGGPRPAAMWGQITPVADGVEMRYLLVRPGGLLSRGIWNVAVNGHAIVRYFERGGATLAAALHEANLAVLKRRLYRRSGSEDIVAPAAPGAFLGRVEERAGFDAAGLFIARTWVHADQLFDSQEDKLRAA